MSFRVSRLLACLLPLLLLAPVFADVTLGGDARAVAMGGAGLASDQLSNGLNPATLADTGPRFGIEMPTVNTRLSGMGYGDMLRLLGSPSLSPREALDLAKNIGDSAPRLDASVSTGLLLPQSDIRVQASLHADVQANDAYHQLLAGNAAPGAQADIRAGGLAVLPGIGLGMPLTRAQNGAEVAVGVRLKPTRAYYSHYIVDANALATGAPRLAPEMAGHNYLSATSFSMDAGLLYRPVAFPTARFALMVNNLVEPKAIALGGGLCAVQLAPRMVSLGTALENSMFTLAADLVDVTGAAGKMQLRVGSELRLTQLLALRGGYNSATGFTAGVGLGGFGVAYSQRAPVLLSQSVTF